MFLKCNILRILLLTFICCSFMTKTNAYCSLEKMKKYAMEACEHLFLQDESREKRSLPSEHDFNQINHIDYTKFNDKRHLISRSTYPRGGYLKVGHEHYAILSQANVIPRYKTKKLHHEKRDRFKREHAPTYNNIPYCCYNKCEEDFFC